MRKENLNTSMKHIQKEINLEILRAIFYENTKEDFVRFVISKIFSFGGLFDWTGRVFNKINTNKSFLFLNVNIENSIFFSQDEQFTRELKILI